MWFVVKCKNLIKIQSGITSFVCFSSPPESIAIAGLNGWIHFSASVLVIEFILWQWQWWWGQATIALHYSSWADRRSFRMISTKVTSKWSSDASWQADFDLSLFVVFIQSCHSIKGIWYLISHGPCYPCWHFVLFCHSAL